MNDNTTFFEEVPRDLVAVLREFRKFQDLGSFVPLERRFGWSGYESRKGDVVAEFAPVLGGGFAVHVRTPAREEWWLYGEDGAFVTEASQAPSPLLVPQHVMESGSPVVSHLFNLLSFEYAQARTGDARSLVVAVVESALRQWRRETQARPRALWRDLAVSRFWAEVLHLERTSVLRWRERQKCIARLYSNRREILSVKERVWESAWAWLPILFIDLWVLARRIAMRPGNNIQGMFRLSTVDVIFWFFRTVRNNIGYSIALAIYGPFTFYFITQPLNPQAMWAVGKVRETYLETVDAVTRLLPSGIELKTPEATSSGTSVETAALPATSLTPAAVAQKPEAEAVQMAARAWQARLKNAQPAHLGLVITTDFPEVDSIPWGERMSHFKSFQIALEERMVFAARMGRIEQVESQLVFPLTVRNAWEEISHYIDEIDARMGKVAGNSPERSFFEREKRRAERAHLYVWDKILRFNRDYRFIVMDAGGDHRYKDRFLGEPLFALVDITESLQRRFPQFRLPSDFEDTKRLAETFPRDSRKLAPGGDLLAHLKAHTKLFAQRDPYDGFEFRTQMTRQWEVLFLLQNKAQEASNNGLMAYTGSIRNAIYALQTLYASKRRDLFPSVEAPNGEVERTRTLPLFYEATLNLLQIDLVSIGPELAERLPFDLDFAQRKAIIEDVRAFVEERSRLGWNFRGYASLSSPAGGAGL